MGIRIIIAAILVFIGLANLNAQVTGMDSIEWLGKNWHYLQVNGDSALYDYGYGVREYLVQWKGDTLALGEKWYSREDSGIKQICFKVKSQNSKSITLLPADEVSARIVEGHKKYRLKNLAQIAPKRFDFSPLKFFVFNPIYSSYLLQADQAGKVYMFEPRAERPWESDTVPEKFLSGQLSPFQFSRLTWLAKKSLIWKHPTIICNTTRPAPRISIWLTFNNRTFEGPPTSYFAGPAGLLIDYLDDLSENVQLDELEDESLRAKMKLEFEQLTEPGNSEK
ncbi:MAG: hypothetical protein H6581_10715 [Bacteroidia bacterium]|nr:hypothetical protein [Bacteroidia bacterium]